MRLHKKVVFFVVREKCFETYRFVVTRTIYSIQNPFSASTFSFAFLLYLSSSSFLLFFFYF